MIGQVIVEKIPNVSSVGLQTTQIWGIRLGPIFATRKAVAPFSNVQSS